MWQKASAITKPGAGEARPPTYGAHHRQRADKRREGPTIEPVSDETPKLLDDAVSDGE